MHIPDGYLSPATCAALYAGAAPFWYVALRRVNAMLHTRMAPLLSLFAAFSFVVMMFNLPLPGGTTGHAVGIGIAAIVLGPWAAMIAVSVALAIQAFFFGDGGILALGANCFNIGIIGSLAAYWSYRLAAGDAPLASPRRIFAAAVAGYAGINAAALLTAVEFGIQPMLYRDASGAPLYAPYPLAIAVPAMMIGHLTFAGLAEAIVSSGVVAYLQRSDISLLKATAPGVDEGEPSAGGGWATARSLWIGLAALLVLTPLGLLATGAAWGEWSPADFNDPETRRRISESSLNRPVPEKAPEGMDRLSAFWTSPMPDYAPAFIRSETFGYILSAMFGVGLIIFTFLLGGWVMRRRRQT